MHGPLPEAARSTTVPIKFVLPVSDLPSSVEAQTSAMHASTSAPGPLCCTLTVALHQPSHQCLMHNFDIREIFECAHLKFTVSGRSIDS